MAQQILFDYKRSILFLLRERYNTDCNIFPSYERTDNGFYLWLHMKGIIQEGERDRLSS